MSRFLIMADDDQNNNGNKRPVNLGIGVTLLDEGIAEPSLVPNKPISDRYFCGSASFGRRDGDISPLEPVVLQMDLPDYKRRQRKRGLYLD